MKKTVAVILSMIIVLPLCLSFSASAATPSYIYIDDINCYGSNNIGPILIYGDGVSARDMGVASHEWWNKVIAEFNVEDGSFVVNTVYAAAAGDTTYADIKLAANEIMLLTHGTISTPHAALGELVVGDKLYAYGFNFANEPISELLSSGDNSGISNVCFTTIEPLLGNGYLGYVTPPVPKIQSLGAKVNPNLLGIRFGAFFENDPSLGEVISLGALLVTEKNLGEDELTLENTNSRILDVQAKTISSDDYTEGKLFEDYDSFTFFVTVIGLKKGRESINIVARPYVTYKSKTGIKTVYADAMTRNYNEVLDAAGGSTTPPDSGEDPTTPPEAYDGPPFAALTFANRWDWSDSLAHQNNIFIYACADETATPAILNEQGVGFLATHKGIVLEYNETAKNWKVASVDFENDGVNTAESATLGKNRIAIIFHNEAVIGQEDGFNFLINTAVVGEEYDLFGDLTALQVVSGKIINVYLALSSAGWTPPEEEIIRPEDVSVGIIQSTSGTYTSKVTPSATSGDVDGLSCALYAPQSNTTGISTYVNLAAINTELYTSSDALGKQSIGCGIASDKNIDNAYLYLCLNSTNWSGDFGLIKRLGDNDWEIVTSEYKNNAWRWNAYAYVSSVTVYYNPDYVYSRWNVMDGQNVYYIKNSSNIKNLQMNLIYSNGKLTYTLNVGGVTVFSVSDSGSISNGKYGRVASITNSNATTSSTSNYLNYISSTKNGRTPAELSNVQFYDTYYYTSSGAKKLTVSAGSLWIYPNQSSSAGYLVNANGDPIVSLKEVVLTSGVVMDIIDIKNY